MAQSGTNPLPDVAAHLIIGGRQEPFLAAMLESIASACRLLIVNDNSPGESPHAQILNESTFGREGRLVLNRTPFTDFATARNVCMSLHRDLRAGNWVAFIDADEVHGDAVTRVARNLTRVAPGVDFVEGYTWHFFASFDWYMSIERRMAFFRYNPQVYWEGAVHEQLRELHGSRLILPYVYAHYGWVMPVRTHAQKGRQYSGLGAPGRILDEKDLDAVALDNYFEYAHRWEYALRFRGRHPLSAAGTIESMRRGRAAEFALADELVRKHQGPAQRIRNALLKLNYEQRWRLRTINPQARRLLAR